MGIRYLTAETEAGRQAIDEVMRRSYVSEIDSVPPAWARVRVVDDVPVSYILADPERRIDFPGGDLHYAFICDVATREDRRGEGHFAALMEDTFAALRAAGLSFAVTHGRHQLYRRFGFDVFTHHSGLFITPQQIERALGAGAPENAAQRLTVEAMRFIHDDLLLVSDVRAATFWECQAALQAAAAMARERGKARILFEHPAAPSYGSRYPIHATLDTRFALLARACGAEARLEEAHPEAGAIPDADWIKVLDVEAFVRTSAANAVRAGYTAPALAMCFDTDAGAITLECTHVECQVSAGNDAGTCAGKPCAGWPAAAVAQWTMGYRSAEALDGMYGRQLPSGVVAAMSALFPPRWRLSRNESWTYKA